MRFWLIKISVLSDRLLFRRAKDIVDVYALSHCVEVRTSEIHDIIKKKSASFGEFTEFNTRRNDVEHAYNRLRGVEGKPLFIDVYSYLEKFLKPFAEKDDTSMSWNSDKQIWECK